MSLCHIKPWWGGRVNIPGGSYLIIHNFGLSHQLTNSKSGLRSIDEWQMMRSHYVDVRGFCLIGRGRILKHETDNNNNNHRRKVS